MQKLIVERERFRQQGNFTAAANELRLKVEEEGFTIEDTPAGPNGSHCSYLRLFCGLRLEPEIIRDFI